MSELRQISLRKLLRVLVAAGVGLAGFVGAGRAEEKAATPAEKGENQKEKEQDKSKEKESKEKEKKEQEKKAADAKKAAESGGGGVPGW